MSARICYRLILVVYIALISCQLVICHLTHSLIILTDSYINLYKILDISLGICHLKTQSQVAKQRKHDQQVDIPGFAVRLFDRTCTYQFKRLPLLGSFVNGLFLAALLMSAAIEGIQTCFHADHAQSKDSSNILTSHRFIYPTILVGFAVLSISMQWLSSKTHKMREEELESESLLDVSGLPLVNRKSFRELDVMDLARLDVPAVSGCSLPEQKASASSLQAQLDPETRRNTICADGSAMHPCLNDFRQLSKGQFDLKTSRRHQSSESVPTNSDNDHRVSLKSLKMASKLDDTMMINVNAVSVAKDVEHFGSAVTVRPKSKFDKWLIVRYCTSPVALTLCALTVYNIDNELVTEIADASLAVLVVVLLFAASYPPMKKAGKVLLQSVPEGVDLDRLKKELLSISPLIIEIKELHVWGLTPHSNRIATCKIVLDQSINAEKEVTPLLMRARSKFLDQNIKCSTIQPIFTVNEDDARHEHAS